MSYPRALAALLIAVIASVGSVCVLNADASESKLKDDTATFMRAKLVSSQRVMQGLVTDDFSLIRKGAQEMKTMSEHVEWPRSRDAIYEHYGEVFRRQCNKLASVAEKRNQDAAHFTFLSLTTTCVECHNYVRGAFRVARDATDPSGPVQLIPAEWDNSSLGRVPSAGP